VDRKQGIVIVAAGLVLAVLGVAAVTGNPSMPNTPLYTIRMEQASNAMSFLPKPVNQFTYVTEKKHDLNCNVAAYHGKHPLSTGDTCPEDTCEPPTCPWTCYETCPNTCNPTCNSPTCFNTCPNTCMTCPATCPQTCEPTCKEETCIKTCFPTCSFSCWFTCQKTC
jgi:hypothetical protein